jgi:CBS domain-containing protein
MLSYLTQNIGSIAERDFAHIGEDSTVAEAAKIMRDKDTTSILITRKDSLDPIGIVTERDILYCLLAQNKDPSTTPLNDIMNYPLIYADEDSSIKDGICLMRNKNIRRLLIKKTGKVIGIVTLKRIVGNIPSQGIDLAEVELPKGRKGNETSCPYCQQKFEDKDKTSKHIDDTHLVNC